MGTEAHACIEIENHATLFRWSTWLAAWIADAYAQRLRQRRYTTWRPYSGHYLPLSHAVLVYSVCL